VLNTDATAVALAEETEEQIDLINRDVSEYVSHILVTAGNGMDVQAIEVYFTISANAERIGDHAVNIGGYVEVLQRKDIAFSQMAQGEIAEMQQIAYAAMAKILHPEVASAWMKAVTDLEQQIDDMTDQYREKHLQRMRKGECTAEALLYERLCSCRRDFSCFRFGKESSIHRMYSSTAILPAEHSFRRVMALYFHFLKSASRICLTRILAA